MFYFVLGSKRVMP